MAATKAKTVSPAALSRISKILPMLSATHAGEIVATAAAIGRVLKAEGYDWHDLAATIVGGSVTPSPPPNGSYYQTASEVRRKQEQAQAGARAWDGNVDDLARAFREANMNAQRRARAQAEAEAAAREANRYSGANHAKAKPEGFTPRFDLLSPRHQTRVLIDISLLLKSKLDADPGRFNVNTSDFVTHMSVTRFGHSPAQAHWLLDLADKHFLDLGEIIRRTYPLDEKASPHAT